MDEKFDMIIMNPPYVRQEKINGLINSKQILKAHFADHGFKIPEKSNLYVYFFLKTLGHLKDQGVLVAITYDECEHMLLSNNKYANSPTNDFDRPFLVSTHGLPLTVAYDRLVAEAARLRVEHYRNRVRLQTEQVWPDLFHIFARAGSCHSWSCSTPPRRPSASPIRRPRDR
jgi:methylase of polypeptide subunit release factors